VPDLLGYGETSNPLNTRLYSAKGMVQDIEELLDHMIVAEAIGIEHDW
jgi:pimeloyl-ACP methyl ester carboxylesterase